MAFPFFYKVLKNKKNSKGNIKLVTRYNILIIIFTFLKKSLVSIILKLISILVNKACIPL